MAKNISYIKMFNFKNEFFAYFEAGKGSKKGLNACSAAREIAVTGPMKAAILHRLRTLYDLFVLKILKGSVRKTNFLANSKLASQPIACNFIGATRVTSKLYNLELA